MAHKNPERHEANTRILKNEERLNYIREALSLKPFVVKLPESYSQIPPDPYALSHKIIRMAQMRQSIDYHIGWFLKTIRDRHLHYQMEFSKMAEMIGSGSTSR